MLRAVLVGGCVAGAVTAGAAAGDVRPLGWSRIAQATGILQHRQPATPRSKLRHARARCRQIAQQFRKSLEAACAAGDRLDAARAVCLPPHGKFKPYSRWDPAAGRCKPRHRFEGGTCNGAGRRYGPDRRHAHALSRSVGMYGKVPARLAEAQKSCRRGVTELRGRVSARRKARQRNCAAARQRNDPTLIDLYCK